MTTVTTASAGLIRAQLQIQADEVTEADIPPGAIRATGVDTSGGLALGILTDDEYFRYPWRHGDALYDEVRLRLTAGGPNFTRVENGVAPALLEHDEDDQVGMILACWVQGPELRVVIAYSTSPDGQAVRREVKAGMVRGLSIGARPELGGERVARRPAGRLTGRLDFDEWELVEASFVSVPANERARVLRAERQHSGRLDAAAAIAAAVAEQLGEDDDAPESARRRSHLVTARTRGLAPSRIGRSRQQGVSARVPDRLLTAAIDTTSAGDLAQDYSPLADIWGRAAGYSRLLRHLPKKNVVAGRYSAPKVTGGPVPATAAEGAASVAVADQVGYTIEAIPTAPKRITVPFRSTIESAFSVNWMGDFEASLRAVIDADLAPLTSALINAEIWTADGTSNRVDGLANQVLASNTSNYVATAHGQALLDHLYDMYEVMDAADVPESRLYVFSPRFHKKFFSTERDVTHDAVSYDQMGRPMLWQVPIVKDPDCPESNDVNDFGRAWLICLEWLRFVVYGTEDGDGETEILYSRQIQNGGDGSHLFVCIKLVDLAVHSAAAMQLLSET